jgi:hypothetical protein
MPNDGAGDFSATVSATDTVVGTASGVFTSNGESDLAVVSSSTLAVEVKNTNVEEDGDPFVSLDLLAGNGAGAFTDTSTYQTVGQPDYDTLGLVAGDFQGSSMGLEVAVPVTNGGGNNAYIDIVPLSTSGT